MNITVRQSLRASAAAVYGILRDYHELHPRILPPAFHDLTITAGGVGAGTSLRVAFTVWGQTRVFEMDVTEPEPGRVLVETDRPTGTVTTFTVEPTGDRTCDVTFDTRLPDTPGFAGWIERFFSRRLLDRTYRDELARLEALAIERER
jgi:hypothetical protein